MAETVRTPALDFEGWACPLPLRDSPTIVMGHGGGGQMSAELIEHLFVPAFGSQPDAGTGRLRGVHPRRGAAGVLHRHVRGAAAVLPRRLHRRPGGQRHGQRPGDERRGAEPPVVRVHPRGGHRPGDRRPDRAGHGPRPLRRRASPSSPATPRSSTPATATRCTSTPPGVGLVPDGVDIRPQRARPGDVVIVSGDDRRARHRDHERARGPRVRHRDRHRQRGPAARSWRRCWPSPRTSTCCATRPAAGWPPR